MTWILIGCCLLSLALITWSLMRAAAAADRILDDEQDFSLWRFQVDAVLYRKTTMHLDQIPDYPLRLWFDQGWSPIAAARHILINEFAQELP